jgi:hypothetical protein
MKSGTKLRERNKKPKGISVVINQMTLQTQTKDACLAY